MVLFLYIKLSDVYVHTFMNNARPSDIYCLIRLRLDLYAGKAGLIHSCIELKTSQINEMYMRRTSIGSPRGIQVEACINQLRQYLNTAEQF